MASRPLRPRADHRVRRNRVPSSCPRESIAAIAHASSASTRARNCADVNVTSGIVGVVAFAMTLEAFAREARGRLPSERVQSNRINQSLGHGDDDDARDERGAISRASASTPAFLGVVAREDATNARESSLDSDANANAGANEDARGRRAVLVGALVAVGFVRPARVDASPSPIDCTGTRRGSRWERKSARRRRRDARDVDATSRRGSTSSRGIDGGNIRR